MSSSTPSPLSSNTANTTTTSSSAQPDGSDGTLEIPKEKVSQIRVATVASLSKIQGKLERFRNDLKGITTEEDILAIKTKLDRVIDASKVLIDFPANPDLIATGSLSSGAINKPNEQLTRVERCRNIFDELILELCSKISVLCARVQGTKNYRKIISSGKFCQELRALLAEFPESESFKAELLVPECTLTNELKGTISRALSRRPEALESLKGLACAPVSGLKNTKTFLVYEEEACKTDANSLAIPSRGWRVEVGARHIAEQPRPLLVTEPLLFTPYYLDYFCGRDHGNFVSKPVDNKDPCILSITVQKRGDDYNCKVLARRKKATTFLQFKEISKRELKYADLVRAFTKRTKPDFDHFSFVQIKETPGASVSIETALYEMETRQVTSHLKFGVIFATQGQGSVEADMYNNVVGSWEFDAFLTCLGQKIELEGWKKYRGGLDSSIAGSRSIYTDWRGIEIMFHVSTLLPFTRGEQQVERKRHIGNDIVVIVFQNGDTPFNPSCIKSNFNKVFLVVSPDRTKMLPDKKLFFKVNCVMAEDINLFPPQLPTASFEIGEYFREFILTKLVNAEIACLNSSTFTYLSVDTKKKMLLDFITVHNL